MYPLKFPTASAALGCLMWFTILILPLGCATAPQPAGPDTGLPPLPSYRPGTTYVFADGSWETVANVTGQLVTWHDHRGEVLTRASDFTYRPVSWQTGLRQGKRRFKARSDTLVRKNSSLWPLQAGKVSSFTEVATSSVPGEAEKSHSVNWTCEVIGTMQVTVMAGEFDTWQIACKRYNNFQNPLRAKVRETRIWNYAPEIEHYVLRERQFTDGRGSSRQELLAVLPPLAGFSDLTKVQMNEAFQRALEHKNSRESTLWSSPNTSGSGQITPTGTFRLADGRFSRRYIIKVNYPDGPRNYYGMAVRDTNGLWVVPRR